MVLAHARHGGQSPYQWLGEAIPPGRAVLDLACGNGPLWPYLQGRRWVGLDSSATELRLARDRGAAPLVRGDALAVPVATAAVGVVACSMALMLVQPLGAALGEVGRLLRPGGTLVALLASSQPLTPGDRARYAHLLAALGRSRLSYPNDAELKEPAGPLGRAGLGLVADERRRFTFSVDSPEQARSLVRSLYLPGIPAGRLRAAVRVAEGWVGSQIGLPLRRLVAIR